MSTKPNLAAARASNAYKEKSGWLLTNRSPESNQRLLLFLRRIALLAGLARFLGFDTAGMAAVFAGGFRLLAAGLFCSEADVGEERQRNDGRCE